MCRSWIRRVNEFFSEDLTPNLSARAEDPALLKVLEETSREHFRWHDDLVTFQKIDGAKWIVMLRQPIAVAYKPVWNLVEKEAVIAAWLVVLYAVGSWLISWLYRHHLMATERIARETSFSQTILAHMPIGIALLDARSGRVLEANEKFLEMAREFGGTPAAGFRGLAPAGPAESGDRRGGRAGDGLGAAIPDAGAGGAGRGAAERISFR